jgi:hypothetical protein
VILPGEAFAITRSGVRPTPDAARADQERQIQRKPLSILRARNGAGFKAVAVGPGKAGEMAVEKVTVELQGARYTLGIDTATGRILSSSYNRRGPQGTFGEFIQTAPFAGHSYAGGVDSALQNRVVAGGGVDGADSGGHETLCAESQNDPGS